MMGLEAKTLSSMLASLAEPLTVAKYRMAYLADTVFPAPDSPLTMIDWFLSSLAGPRNTKQHKETYFSFIVEPKHWNQAGGAEGSAQTGRGVFSFDDDKDKEPMLGLGVWLG